MTIPPPPPVAALRALQPELKAIPAGKTFWRCNGVGHSNPLYFGKSGRNRFDDVHCVYGVMYASLSHLGAMAETILHNQLDSGKIDRSIPQSRFDAYWLAEIDVREDLLMIDFVEDHPRFDLTTAISNEVTPNDHSPGWDPYVLTKQWSAAISDAFPTVAGIAYSARHAGGTTSVALFERAMPKIVFQRKHVIIDSSIREKFLSKTGHTLDKCNP